MTMQRMEKFEYQGDLYDLAAIEGFDNFHLPAVLRGIPFREPHTALHRGFQTTFSLNAKQWLVVRAIHAWVDPGFRPPIINEIIPWRGGPDKSDGRPLTKDELGEELTAVDMPDPPVEPDAVDWGDWSIEDYDMLDGELEEPVNPEDAKTDVEEEDNTGSRDAAAPESSEGSPGDIFPWNISPFGQYEEFPDDISYRDIDVPLCYTGRMLIGNGRVSSDFGYFSDGGYSSPLSYETVLELTFLDGVLQKVTDVSSEAKRLRESLRSKLDRENDLEHHVFSWPFSSQFLYDLEYQCRWTDKTTVFCLPVKLNIFLIDASGCSANELHKLNALIQKMGSALENFDQHKNEIAIMEIGETCRWITNSENLWIDFDSLNQVMISPSGAPNYAHAFDLLNRSLSKHHLLRLYDGFRSWLMPTITLVSSGKAVGSWAKSLNQLQKNVWFQQSHKFPLGLCHHHARKYMLDLLSRFCSRENIIESIINMNMSQTSFDIFTILMTMGERYNDEIDYPSLLLYDKNLNVMPIRPEEQLQMDASAPLKESLTDLNQDFSGWEADETLTNEPVLPKNRFLFYFVLDRSEQMSGVAEISAAEAIRQSSLILAETDMEDPLMSIWVGMLEIKSEPAWSAISADHTESIKDFIWFERLPEGNASIGVALQELDQALSAIQKDDLPSLADGWNPIIVFITASHSADDWEAAFNSTLANNELYRRAEKIAIGLEGADPEMLKVIMFDGKQQNSKDPAEPCPGKVLLAEDPSQITGFLIEHVFNKFRASAGLPPIKEKTIEELRASIDAKMALLLGEQSLNDDPSSEDDGFGNIV